MYANETLLNAKEYEYIKSISMFVWKIHIYRCQVKEHFQELKKTYTKADLGKIIDEQRMVDSLK